MLRTRASDVEHMGCADHADTDAEMPCSYIERSEWFEKMGKTHKQTKCPNCGLFAIWVPKKGRAWSTAKTRE